MELNEEHISYKKKTWAPGEVKTRLEEYLAGDGDAELLTHFMVASKFWYDQLQMAKTMYPVFFVLGFCCSTILSHYFF